MNFIKHSPVEVFREKCHAEEFYDQQHFPKQIAFPTCCPDVFRKMKFTLCHKVCHIFLA